MVTDLLYAKLDVHHLDTQANLARWLKQCMYMPWLARRLFDRVARTAIENAVKAAEVGHAGEIRVVIESRLPLSTALRQGTFGRALDLFASLHVWDTALNSGVLLYINLCERRVEIVADRGINAKVDPLRWQTICAAIIAKLSDAQHQHGVVAGVELIGLALREYYAVLESEAGNELSDAPLFL